MTTPTRAERARIARLVHEAPAIIFRVQTEEGELHDYRLTRDQLFNINADSAAILAGRPREETA
jgi:hypothetical protein